MLDSVVTEPTGAGQAAVSGKATTAYVTGPVVPSDRELVWVQREGLYYPSLRTAGLQLPATAPRWNATGRHLANRCQVPTRMFSRSVAWHSIE